MHKTRKDKRRSTTGAKSVSRSCRNHGSCPWCKNNRQYKNIKRDESFKVKFNETKYT